MDRRERNGDLQAAMIALQQGGQATMWTALPARIVSFDPAKQTVVAQPTIQARVEDVAGAFSWQTMPLCVDCPVYFPHGGGVTMTFPVKAGDECLLVFASRCIDSWWQSGGVQVQADLRMHDLSDGFAFVGFSSNPAVISSISTTTAQFRSDDGLAFVEIDPASHLIRMKTPGKITLDAGDDILIKSATKVTTQAPAVLEDAAATYTAKAPAIAYFGNMAWVGYTGGAGTVSVSNMTINYTGGAMTYNGKNITDTHTHGGVTTGGGTTAAVS